MPSIFLKYETLKTVLQFITPCCNELHVYISQEQEFTEAMEFKMAIVKGFMERKIILGRSKNDEYAYP